MDSALALSLDAAGGDHLARAEAWVGLAAGERKREAARAANEHDAPLLVALADAWLTLYGKSGTVTSPYTRRNYAQGITALVTGWSDENLLHPRYDAGVLWIRRLERDGLRPATIGIYLAAGRTLYKALRWAGATTDDPLRDVKPAHDPVPRWEKRLPYTETEVDKILSACPHPSERALILTLAHGGLRASEVLALTWGDCNLAEGTLLVRHGKGRKARTVACSPTLRDALIALGPGPSWLRVWDDLHDTRALRRLIERICDDARVPYKGAHSFRHYCGTRLVRESGGALEVARDHLGHSSIAVTEVYSHMAQDSTRKAVGRW